MNNENKIPDAEEIKSTDQQALSVDDAQTSNAEDVAHTDKQPVTESNDAETSPETVSADANVEVDTSQHLSQYGGMRKVDQPETEENADTTLKNSTARLAGTGKVRFLAISVTLGVVFLGGAGFLISKAATPDPEKVEPGSVNVPKTKAAASAVVNPEQAEYLRQQQIKAGEKAEEAGSTYISPILTVNENTQEELAAPTQPGLKGPAISNERTFKDKQGKVYTAEQAAILQQQGVRIAGVTEGKGSITDPYLNTSNRALPATRNSKNANAETGPNSVNAQKVETAYEPYTIKPYTPNSNAKSEFETTEVANLDKSAQEAEQWKEQYLAMRLNKANYVNSVTQLAFSEQVAEIEKTVKSSAVTKSGLGTYSRTHYSVEIPKEAADSTPEPKPAVPAAEEKPVIYAGETHRAILKNQVNTDHGSEVIATLLTGPLKGATIIGTIHKQNDNIGFSFTRILRKGKSEINISAVGRELGTNSSGMADDINKHYLTRYTALATSSVLSGVGKSYEQTAGSNAEVAGNGTVVTSASDPTNKRIIGTAVGELGGEISGEIKDLARKPTTYIANNGKIFNVFFNQNVLNGVSTTVKRN